MTLIRIIIADKPTKFTNKTKQIKPKNILIRAIRVIFLLSEYTLISILIFFFTVFFYCTTKAQLPQENYSFTYFGVSLSPVIPSNLIQKHDFTISNDSITFDVKQKPSYVFGMEVKHDFSRFLAFQTGINFAKRIYNVSTIEKDTTINSSLKIIGYEIPVLILGFVRVTKNIYADLSAGFCMNFYPSDIVVQHYYGRRTRWIQNSLLLNMGLEFRKENVGNFYLGLLYQHHEKSMMTIFYYRDQIYGKSDMHAGVSGNYLSLNLKYYFPQNPVKIGNQSNN